MYSRDVKYVAAGGQLVHHSQCQQGDAGHEGGVRRHKHSGPGVRQRGHCCGL